MALTIASNIEAQFAARNLDTQQNRVSESIGRLSSGLRIQTGEDDPSGLVVREGLRAQVSQNEQGVRNAEDAQSALQLNDGALASIADNLERMQTLAESSATATLNSDQRAANQQEFDALRNEIDRIANTTEFNGIQLLNDSSFSGAISLADNQPTNEVQINGVDATSSGLGVQQGQAEKLEFDNQVTSTSGEVFVSTSGSGSQTAGVTITTSGGTFQATFADDSTFSLDTVVTRINQAATNGPNEDVASVQTDSNGNSRLVLEDTAEDSNTNTNQIEVSTQGGATFDSAEGTDFSSNSFVRAQGSSGLSVDTQSAAQSAISSLETAISSVSDFRADFGAVTNRVQAATEALNSEIDNLNAAESRISDVDVARESAQFQLAQTRQQAAGALLTQANSLPQQALQLLGG